MALTMTTKVKLKFNRKPWEKIERNLRRGGKYTARVGFFGGVHSRGIPTAQIAAWNEEGHLTGWGGYSPPRPFIRIGTVQKLKEKNWFNKYIPYVAMIAAGRMNWKTLNQIIAKDVVEIMKDSILDWNLPANTPATVAIKGFNDPLIHTGKMYDSVTFKIVRRGI